MDDFERIFEAYGADYQVTLGRFMGNRKMYMKFLGMLFQDENLSKLVEPLRTGEDREDYTKMYEDVCRQFKRAEKLRADLAEISE